MPKPVGLFQDPHFIGILTQLAGVAVWGSSHLALIPSPAQPYFALAGELVVLVGSVFHIKGLMDPASTQTPPPVVADVTAEVTGVQNVVSATEALLQAQKTIQGHIDSLTAVQATLAQASTVVTANTPSPVVVIPPAVTVVPPSVKPQ
jgi:hypothetical protein